MRYKQEVIWIENIDRQDLLGLLKYSTALVFPSLFEGFGIPVIEAQACGTRVITSDQTAQPELVGDGWMCQTQPFWDHSQKAFFHTPITESILECLEKAWEAPRTTSQDALNHAKQYQADEVFNTHWKPIMGLLS
jgi:glycosyltransferase involved in cell wall biosynthesis